MAEFLIKAQQHWMDSLTQSEVDKMTLEEKQQYEARSQVGDIIVVRPDGWEWGKEECLPNFVVIKIPEMSINQAKKYEDSLTEQFIDIQDRIQIRILKHRKYQVILSLITDLVLKNKNVVSYTTKEEVNFINNIIQKTS